MVVSKIEPIRSCSRRNYLLTFIVKKDNVNSNILNFLERNRKFANHNFLH